MAVNKEDIKRSSTVNFLFLLWMVIVLSCFCGLLFSVYGERLWFIHTELYDKFLLFGKSWSGVLTLIKNLDIHFYMKNKTERDCLFTFKCLPSSIYWGLLTRDFMCFFCAFHLLFFFLFFFFFYLQLFDQPKGGCWSVVIIITKKKREKERKKKR